jgi:hypothetical protein
VLERLVTNGWETTLGDAIGSFAPPRRDGRATGLVWAYAVKRFLRRAQIHPFALDEDGPCDHHGRRLELAPDTRVWPVHPAELSDEELITWQHWQRRRRPAFEQLDRLLVLHPRLDPTLGRLVEALPPHPPDLDALRAAGYVRTGDNAHGMLITPSFIGCTKIYRHRNESYRVDVEERAPWLRVVPPEYTRSIPAPVLHEIARDLMTKPSRPHSGQTLSGSRRS